MRDRFAATTEEQELEKNLKEMITLAFLLHMAAEEALSLSGDFAIEDFGIGHFGIGDFAIGEFGIGEPANQAKG